MTTHVFIVDDNTFKYHLEYMFAGTGAKKKSVDFNNKGTSRLHHSTENGLVAMMADGCRVRKGDLIIFYLQQNSKSKREGKFYGVFQAVDNGIFLDNFDEKQYLYKELKKSLTFRLKIKPYEVYSVGVTEWEALDEIKSICSPYQMLWSLIYRKLKGNRGNTMITIYESEKLIGLIRTKNANKYIAFPNYTFDGEKIVENFNPKRYMNQMEKINILPRLIAKYNAGKAYETHLQMYITQNLGLGINKTLDNSLEIENKNIEWLGNEVSCGVGMQRIDIMFSIQESQTKRILCPIELKAVSAYEDNTRQLTRYIDWIEQYYLPNRISIIQPVLICKKRNLLSDALKSNFNNFNKRIGILPLKYIEYEIQNNNLVFKTVEYEK